MDSREKKTMLIMAGLLAGFCGCATSVTPLPLPSPPPSVPPPVGLLEQDLMPVIPESHSHIFNWLSRSLRQCSTAEDQACTERVAETLVKKFPMSPAAHLNLALVEALIGGTRGCGRAFAALLKVPALIEQQDGASRQFFVPRHARIMGVFHSRCESIFPVEVTR